MSAVSSSKYQPLTAHLRAQRASRVPMSFAEVERVLGTKLPPSASSHRAWWSNDPTNNIMTKAWLEAGFQSEQVDLDSRKLVFRRVANRPVGDDRREARSPTSPPRPSSVSSAGCAEQSVSTGDLTEPADPDWAGRIDR